MFVVSCLWSVFILLLCSGVKRGVIEWMNQIENEVGASMIYDFCEKGSMWKEEKMLVGVYVFFFLCFYVFSHWKKNERVRYYLREWKNMCSIRKMREGERDTSWFHVFLFYLRINFSLFYWIWVLSIFWRWAAILFFQCIVFSFYILRLQIT